VQNGAENAINHNLNTHTIFARPAYDVIADWAVGCGEEKRRALAAATVAYPRQRCADPEIFESALVRRF